MQIYTLPSDEQPRVLLTGDADFVVEFATILKARAIDVAIFPPLEDMMGMEPAEDQLDFGEVDASVYGAFADLVLNDPRSQANSFTMIVDLSVADPGERRLTLEVAASINPRATILASSLTHTVTDLSSALSFQSRIVGVGLLPSMMQSTTTVDYAPGLNTAEPHAERARHFLEGLGYATERVADRAGLVQMRVLATLINEAAFAVMEGVATPADIDKAMQLGTNYPKGLLAWADDIGLAIVALVLEGLYREYGQERYRPCVLLKQYVRAGWFGRSAGRGFHVYPS